MLPARALLLIALLACLALACAVHAPSPTEERRGARAPATTVTLGANMTKPPACPGPPTPLPDAPERPTFVLQDGHTSSAYLLALSDNGRTLASSGLDGTICIWDTTTGHQLRKIRTHGISLRMSLSGAGDMLAYEVTDSASGSEAVTLDLAKSAEPRSLKTYGAFQLSPDGRSIAVGGKSLRIYDPRTGAVLRELTPLDPPSAAPPAMKLPPGINANLIWAVGYDETGGRLAVASGLDIAVLDTTTWKPLLRRPHPAPSDAGSFPSTLHLRGDTLVVTSPMRVDLVSVRLGGPAVALPVPAQSTAINGDRLLTTGPTGVLAAWELATGAPVSAPGFDRLKGYKLAVSRDGSTIALGAQNAPDISILEGRSLRRLRSLEGKTSAIEVVAVQPDGSALAAGSRSGAIARWDLRSGALTGITPGWPGADRAHMAYDDSGSLLAFTNGTFVVRVYDAASGSLLRQWEPTGVHVVMSWFLPGSKELATLDRKGSLDIWDLTAPIPAPPRGHKGLWTAPKPPVRSLTIPVASVAAAGLSPDRKQLVLAADQAVITTPDPTGRLPYKEVYGAFKLVLVEVPAASVRWSVPVTAAPETGWVGFSPDAKSVLVSSREDPRGAPPPNLASPRGWGSILRDYDGRTGALARSLSVGTWGPVAARPGVVALGGREPVILEWPSLSARRILAPDYLVTSIAPHPVKEAFVLAGDSGAASLVSTKTGDILAFFTSAGGMEYVTWTRGGTFRSSIDGARSVVWTFDAPLEAFSFEQFAARFERPDVIARALAGEDIPSPASVIRPPSVHLDRSGQTGAALASRSTRVRARVASDRRVDRVRVFVNGRAAADKLVCAPKGDLEIDVPLQGGQNRLTVIAYDAEGFASNPEVMDVTSVLSAAARPDLWVVSIGVSQYPGLGRDFQLDFADDDARSISEAVAGLAGPERPFAKIHTTTLLDSQVTVARVEAAIRALSAMGPDDLAVVFLAGHGVAIEPGKMVYLTHKAAMNAASIREHGVGWEVIRAALAEARGRVFLLLDACHSGHVSTELVAPNEALAQALSAGGRAGVLVFAAARGSQWSYEVPSGGVGTGQGGARSLERAWEGTATAAPRALAGGHGLFTAAVLEALGGSAPDRDRSGAIEVGELIDFVTERVRSASNGLQTPWVARREMFGDFVIVPARP